MLPRTPQHNALENEKFADGVGGDVIFTSNCREEVACFVERSCLPSLFERKALVADRDVSITKQLDNAGLRDGVGFGQAAGRLTLLIAIGHLGDLLDGESMNKLGGGLFPALARFSGRMSFLHCGEDLVEAGFVVATSVGVHL